MDFLRRLGIRIDVTTGNAVGQVKALEGSFMGLNGTALTLGKTIAGIWAAKRGFEFVSEFASLGGSVSEQLNILQVAFEDQAASVQTWADTVARNVGRSRFELRKYAAGLGALLRPMAGTSEAAADMSTGLAQVAIDLASLFETSDEEAFEAIRSGITGQVKPLRRYGLDLTDATLKEFALSEGLDSNTQAMTQAQKTMLRYQYIIRRSSLATGDAEKTQTSLVNASKALKAQFVDLMTELSLGLTPAFAAIVNGARDLTKKLTLLDEKTGILKFVFASLGIAAALAGRKMILAGVSTLIAWAPAIAAFLLAAAAIASILIVAEDLYQFFKGDAQTATEDFINQFFGLEEGREIIKGLRDDFNSFIEVIKNLNIFLEPLAELMKSFKAGAAIFKVQTDLARPIVPASLKGSINAEGQFGGPSLSPKIMNFLESRRMEASLQTQPYASPGGNTPAAANTVTNTFNISGNDPTAIGIEVEKILNKTLINTKENFITLKGE